MAPLAATPDLSLELLEAQARGTLHQSSAYLGLQVGHLQVQLIQVFVHKCDERLSRQRGKGNISNFLQTTPSPHHDGLRPPDPLLAAKTKRLCIGHHALKPARVLTAQCQQESSCTFTLVYMTRL